jgi:hypothetical protein
MHAHTRKRTIHGNAAATTSDNKYLMIKPCNVIIISINNNIYIQSSR